MFLFLLACSSTPSSILRSDEIQSFEVGSHVATVSQTHLSVALDLGQVLGAEFWNPDIEAEEAEIEYPEYDFSRPLLHVLAKELSPALLRIGGTESDRIYYAMDQDIPNPLPDGYTSVLTSTHWDRVSTFAQEVGFELFFTVNAGPGPRNEGSWNNENTKRLFSYAQGSPVAVWEFGNEPNGFPLFYGFSLEPAEYASDTETFSAQVAEWFPDSQVAGPAVAYWPILGEFSPYTGDVIANEPNLDIITWHYYPTQSPRCPIQNRLGELDTLQNPENLNEILVWHNEIQSHIDESNLDIELWLGETGNAQCGGVPAVSDRWAGSMWWIDQLGLMARNGEPVMIRQTLSGSDYGLLDDTTLKPRPDYWASVLWKRLMGIKVLDISNDDANMRIYGHCHPTEGVTFVAINLHQDKSIGFAQSGTAYTLEADELGAANIRLNGEELSLVGDTLPSLEGTEQTEWVIPSQGISFLHQPQRTCP